MKYLYLLLFLFIVSCVDGEEILGGCYVSPAPDVSCIEVYAPVCACNDIVYSNSCEAEKAGNLKWKSTSIEQGEPCRY
tara:strand:+ start:170 stop:403 length:234 start_codon:yes stop_codon:yes gene_type:complete